MSSYRMKSVNNEYEFSGMMYPVPSELAAAAAPLALVFNSEEKVWLRGTGSNERKPDINLNWYDFICSLEVGELNRLSYLA
jgi:hypothetical protein